MEIKKLISEMTLEEKASLLSGLDFWHTKPVERLGIPSIMVSEQRPTTGIMVCRLQEFILTTSVVQNQAVRRTSEKFLQDI